MDAQLKRGVIEACVLKLLTKSDSYGYELSRDVGGIIPIKNSVIRNLLIFTFTF